MLRAVAERAPSVVVIVGETLGYLSRAVIRKFPLSRVVAIALSPDLRKLLTAPGGVEVLFANHDGLEQTVLRSIPERDFDRIVVVSWEASVRVWQRAATAVFRDIESSVRIATGGIATTASFGRRWISNLVRNVTELERLRGISHTIRPVIAAASGPSLDRHLNAIRSVRRLVDIWALPSSVQALNRASIQPDVVITTDPGFYASLHYRGIGDSGATTIAAPLTAYPGFLRLSSQAIIIDQDSVVERELFARISVDRYRVPMNGSVAGSLFEMVDSLRAPLIFAGLDLAVARDGEHAQPHPFDSLYRRLSSRVSPFDSAIFGRSVDLYPDRLPSGLRTNAPLRTYAGWFSRNAGKRRLPAYRLGPSEVEIDGMIPVTERDLHQLCASFRSEYGHFEQRPGRVSRAVRIAEMDRILVDWIDGLGNLRDRPIRTKTAGEKLLATTPGALLPLVASRTIIRARKAMFSGDLDGHADGFRSAIEEGTEFLSSLLDRVSVR